MKNLIIFLLTINFAFAQLRSEVTIANVFPPTFNGGGNNNIVYANNGSLYMVYVDNGSDVVYRKSTDGLRWGPQVIVFTGTVTNLAIWYDRWSGLSSDYIHCAYTESANDDTLYRAINTGSSDALGTQTVIFAGASTAGGSHLSITRAVGGNVYCKTVIDAGAEGGFYRLPNANVPSGAWDAARTVDETIATNDQMILVPDLTAADNQDIMAIFWDASATEISRKLYDDSGNSWTETSIATSMTALSTLTAFPNFNVDVDLTNSQILLVAWSNVDAANADLRCWTVDNTTITEKTNVVLNSTDDQGICAISLNTTTGDWYVFYAGTSDGARTWTTSLVVAYKVSTDGGTTWGSENVLLSTGTSTLYDIRSIYCIPRSVSSNVTNVGFYRNGTNVSDLYMSLTLPYAFGYGSSN
jgi:hypothetical protein